MADPASIIQAVSLGPQEAIAFLRQKVNVTSEHWTDLWNEAHSRGFMVAGAASEALVEDFRKEVARALEDGTGFNAFRKGFDQIVAKHGWVHNGTAAWRAEIIYATNMSTAYSAGRYAQMTEPATLDAFPYWQYEHNPAQHPRQQHVAWNGLVLRADDPWWHTHYPPNGWRCHCTARPVSRAELASMGKIGPDKAPAIDLIPWKNPKTGEILYVPKGIDPGFAYNPGKAWIDAAGHPAIKPLEARSVPARPPSRADNAAPPRSAAPPRPAAQPHEPATEPVIVQPAIPSRDHPIPPPPADLRRPRVRRPDTPAPAAPTPPSNPTPATPEQLRNFLQEPRGSIVVGDIPPEVQRAIGGDGAPVRLSAETLIKQGGSHPDLSPADYGALQAVISHPSLVLRQDKQRVMLIKRQGVVYRAVIKSTGAGHEMYIVSFHRIRASTLERLLKLYPVIWGTVRALNQDDVDD